MMVAPNVMMNVHDPPKAATRSAMRSPKVISSSMTSLGFRLARTLTSCCEAEELALRRLVHDDFLLIFVHGRDPHHAGDQHVSSSARVADLPDALALREGLDFDLPGQYRS